MKTIKTMSIKDQSKKEIYDKTFIIRNTSVIKLNTIRRIILGHLETYRLEIKNVIENDTTTYRELLEQRIKLLPISTDKLNMNKLQNYSILLCKENKQNRSEYITSKDIKLFSQNENNTRIEIKNTLFKPDEITGDYNIITQIHAAYDKKSKKIDIELALIRGCGNDNISFSPAAIVSFKKLKTDTFKLNIESIGILPVTTILNNAFEKITSKLKETMLYIQNKDNITFDNSNSITITIINEDGTISRLINEQLNSLDNIIIYTGCKRVHPLINKTILRIMAYESYNPLDILYETIKSLITYFETTI